MTAIAKQELLNTPWLEPQVIAHTKLLMSSYERLLGKPLLLGHEQDSDIARAGLLFEVPYPITAHSAHPDPIITYANRMALDLWRYEWHEIIGMPSRQTAEPLPVIQEQRNNIIEVGKQRGFLEGYSGRRISKRGERFEIVNCTMWNIIDESGARFGQGLRVNNWWYV